MKKYYLMLIAAALNLSASSVTITDKDKARAKALVEQMTLDEKIAYLSGETSFSLRPIERLGIPRILLADGPQGIRNHCKHSTLYPSGIAAAATWNRDLIHRYGESLGDDARARGVGILLGPGVNIYRYPLCGRNFEYMGEDPYLASEMACQYIDGVQSKGVVSTIKHFAANNQEWNRHHASSDVDERTLQEIYFPTFRKAVKKAGVGAVMNSYNLLNGIHATENPWLNKTILRDEWGFDGVLMSDWTSVYSTVNAANAGLDLEMPKAVFFTDSLLKAAVSNGRVSMKTIDDKVTHMLQIFSAFGLLDRQQQDKSIPMDNPKSKNTALATAREGIVLLKNEGNILPLKGRTAVMGINADTIVSGGGSGAVYAYSISPLSTELPKFNKKTISISTDGLFDDAGQNFFTDSSLSERGFKCEYFDNIDFAGSPAIVKVDPEINFNYGKGGPSADFPVDNFSAVWTGYYLSPKDENLRIAIGGDDGYRLTINDSVVAEHWGNHAYDRRTISYPVEKGKGNDFKIEYFESTGGAKVDFVAHSLNKDKLKKMLAGVDNVVINTGFTSQLEGEGYDRAYGLPEYEENFIREVASINPNVVVVLNSGGEVDLMPWLNEAKGIVMAWYPGQEGGTALAEILTGKISPSGKLPITYYRSLADNPAHDSYYPNRTATRKSGKKECDHVEYREGVFHGYRGSDKADVKPLYPFGYGLSYTSFEFSDLTLTKIADNKISVNFTVKNTGKRDGSEVAQVYVSDLVSSTPRPIKELKGFEKVSLKPGESKNVIIILDDEAFAFYDIDKHKFIVEPGEFEILVGNSSTNLPLHASISL